MKSIHFNKKGMVINQKLSNEAFDKCCMTDSWEQLCKLCKSLVRSLSNYEYIKFKWMSNRVVFWRGTNIQSDSK